MIKDYCIEELETLLDYKIIGIVYAGGKYERYYGLKIKNSRTLATKILWFLQDEEDNGPGSFTIENYDEAKEFVDV